MKEIDSMRQLRNVFSQYPKAKNFETPEWLVDGKIINL